MESLSSTFILLLLVAFSCFVSSEAYTTNNGNITIKWDLRTWTPDGYTAVVSAYNYQKQRSVPGWTISWKWTKKEVIWGMVGAQTTEQGNCSMYKGYIPQSCLRNPQVVDLLPGAPYNQQIANCCKNGVLKPGQESSFQLSVGQSGSTVKTVRMPIYFKFTAPKQLYCCGPTKNVRPTRFITAHKRRMTRALMTWNVTCVFHKTK